MKNSLIIDNNCIKITEIRRQKDILINNIECIIVEKYHSKLLLTINEMLETNFSLKEWESILPKKKFVRINRGTIINLNYVKKIEKSSHNNMTIYMQHYEFPINMSPYYISKTANKINRIL